MSKNRYLFMFIFGICIVLSGVAFYYNYVRGVQLCPLCSMQLLCYYLIAILCLITFFHIPEHPFGRYVYAFLTLLLSIAGAVFSSMQVWLQGMPLSRSIPCAPNLTYMLKNYGLHKLTHIVFYGRDNCTMVHWRFLGLSMAAWSLIFFILIIIATGMLILNAKKPDNS